MNARMIVIVPFRFPVSSTHCQRPFRSCEKLGLRVRSRAAPSALGFLSWPLPGLHGRAYFSAGPSGLEICASGKHWTHACSTRAEGPAHDFQAWPSIGMEQNIQMCNGTREAAGPTESSHAGQRVVRDINLDRG